MPDSRWLVFCLFLVLVALPIGLARTGLPARFPLGKVSLWLSLATAAALALLAAAVEVAYRLEKPVSGRLQGESLIDGLLFLAGLLLAGGALWGFPFFVALAVAALLARKERLRYPLLSLAVNVLIVLLSIFVISRIPSCD